MSVKYDSISTRDAFGIALVEAAREHPNLFAIGADTTKSMGFKPMMKEFPDRVINNGIAEQNMAMIGAGIAAAGGRAVVATYAPFASMRISEQVRTFICYPNLDVKIISGLAGLSGNIEGVTHQGLEDIGVIRSMANMVIVVPADAASCTVAAREVLKYVGPAYLRIGRGAVEQVFDSNYKFVLGKANLLDAAGTDVAVICNGCAVARVLRAKAIWEGSGIHARIIEMPTVKPIDSDAILSAAHDCGRIVTVEEHNVIGGLGSAVCEVVCSGGAPCRVTRVGIDDMYTESGPHDQLLDKYNLSPEHIAAVVTAAV